MKKAILWSLLCAIGFTASSQNGTNNTLLWRISGKNISRPSYLFGTIHMLCSDDIQLSDSLIGAIRECDRVYLELDMDNIFELIGAMNKMKMRNDTTLADLLTAEEYDTVKDFFKDKGGPIPFSMLETYKPMLAASLLMETSFNCDHVVAMEQLIMKEAKANGKGIKGLETMAYQLSIFDSIPYKIQAQQLVKYVKDYGKKDEGNKEYEELADAYRNQQLDKLEAITIKDEMVAGEFSDLLLYNRNLNWIKKLEDLLDKNALVIAVGAGHLPGPKGVINLLRKEGYKVEPVKNQMSKKREVEL